MVNFMPIANRTGTLISITRISSRTTNATALFPESAEPSTSVRNLAWAGIWDGAVFLIDLELIVSKTAGNWLVSTTAWRHRVGMQDWIGRSAVVARLTAATD